jgi:hypothetical protein
MLSYHVHLVKVRVNVLRTGDEEVRILITPSTKTNNTNYTLNLPLSICGRHNLYRGGVCGKPLVYESNLTVV